jgi:deoxycytidylate deaminase
MAKFEPFDYAVELAKNHHPENTGKKSPQSMVALALNKKGKIISIGYNSYSKTHPHQAKYAIKCGQPKKIWLHAEVAALIKAKESVDKIVVVRVLRDGSVANATPCPVCAMAIKAAGVRKIEYST